MARRITRVARGVFALMTLADFVSERVALPVSARIFRFGVGFDSRFRCVFRSLSRRSAR